MSEEARAEWETVATFATGLEAEMARGLLEEQGIPVLVRSNSAGIFGFAFYQGSVPGGVTLQVPSPEIDRARELLNDDEPADLGTADAGSDPDEDA